MQHYHTAYEFFYLDDIVCAWNLILNKHLYVDDLVVLISANTDIFKVTQNLQLLLPNSKTGLATTFLGIKL